METKVRRRSLLLGGAAALVTTSNGRLGRAAAFNGNSTSWTETLTHNEVEAASSVDALAAQKVPPQVDSAITSAVDYLRAIDRVGGNNGVRIQGSGTVMIAIPQDSSLDAAAVSVVNILGSGLTAAAASAALAAFKTALIGRLHGTGFSAPHATVHAGSDTIGGEETLLLVHLTNGHLALISHAGYFSADQNRKNTEIIADRQEIGPWEQWELANNSDGTVSFRASSGYMVADLPTSHVMLFANRGVIGPWERFYIKAQGGGYIALQAAANAKFVSVVQ